MAFESIHKVYLLGIGGIGMSALARYFYACGKEVAGYDLTPSVITGDLEALGINIHYREDIQEIPASFRNKNDCIVVRTPAVPDQHLELKYFREEGYTVLKRAEVLSELFNGKRGIAIAGTHGKTSVTSMSAFIMSESALGCHAFLGGILKNTGSNLIMNESSLWVVAEADEFDRSFLFLKPEIALVTWIDADHLDIYSSAAEIEKAFQLFLDNVKEGGTIVVKQGIEVKNKKPDLRKYTYALDSEKADFHASKIRIQNSRYIFHIKTPQGVIEDVRLTIPGRTNIENAVGAASLAFCAGVPLDVIGESLSSFKGVQRRFDIQYENGRRIYIDDYAHHPRELDAVIGSVRMLFPGKKITGVFQPHLYSRTRDFSNDFAQSLSKLDELILLDIYPAREKPIEGVSSDLIFDNVTIPSKTMCSKHDLLKILSAKDFEILLTMGAGDIDRFVEPVKKLVANK
jgi:UDP-N-acetylmuramate--alanine ligase